jgi:Helix-turn-helix domain
VKAIAEQSLYEILEVRADAAPGEIAEAYERARAIYAPNSLAVYTLVAPEEAAALSRRIEEARAVLLDPEARARYDAGRVSGEPPVPPPTPTALPPVIPPVKSEAATPPTVTALELAVAATPGEAAPGEAGTPATPHGAETPVEASTPAVPEAAAPAPAAPPATAPEAAEPAPAATPPALQPTPAAAARGAPAAAAAEAEREPPPPLPPPRPPQSPGFSVPEGTPWTGEVLRRVRESRGLTILQIAERTKVARHHLEAIEADRYGVLPAAVYLRGILVSLAKELRLDGQKVSRSYLEQARGASEQPPAPKPR